LLARNPAETFDSDWWVVGVAMDRGAIIHDLFPKLSYYDQIVREMVRRTFVISQCLKGSNAILRYNPFAEPRSGTRYRADSGSQARQERDLKAMITKPDQSCRRPAPCPGTLSGFRP
jgi:hypothetical protein